MEETMRDAMRAVTRLFLGIATVGAAACSGGSDSGTGPSGGSEPPDTPPAASVAGTWKLTSANNNALPALIWDDHTAEGFGAQMYIVSGSIVLRADGTYRQTSNSRLVIEGVTDQTWGSINDGTYSVSVYDGGSGYDPTNVEGTITFRGEAGGQITLPITGYTITHNAMMPGAAGGPDVPVTLIYVRE
jgi:hypothetical protein